MAVEGLTKPKKPWSHYDLEDQGGDVGGLLGELERKPRNRVEAGPGKKGPSLLEKIAKWLNLG